MKKYTLAALQMAYLPVSMKKDQEGETCLYCWKSDCGCGHKHDIKGDSFINLTTKAEFKYA